MGGAIYYREKQWRWRWYRFLRLPQWWIRSFQGYDTFYAFGAHGQFIFVVPQLELVTVIASHSLSDSYAPRPYFSDYILSAYTG